MELALLLAQLLAAAEAEREPIPPPEALPVPEVEAAPDLLGPCRVPVTEALLLPAGAEPEPEALGLALARPALAEACQL